MCFYEWQPCFSASFTSSPPTRACRKTLRSSFVSSYEVKLLMPLVIIRRRFAELLVLCHPRDFNCGNQGCRAQIAVSIIHLCVSAMAGFVVWKFCIYFISETPKLQTLRLIKCHMLDSIPAIKIMYSSIVNIILKIRNSLGLRQL